MGNFWRRMGLCMMEEDSCWDGRVGRIMGAHGGNVVAGVVIVVIIVIVIVVIVCIHYVNATRSM